MTGIILGSIDIVVGFLAMFAFTAYLVRGLQKIFQTRKRAMTERGEELGENDDIPLTERNEASYQEPPNPVTAPMPELSEAASVDVSEYQDIRAPAPTQDPGLIRMTSAHPLHPITSHGERFHILLKTLSHSHDPRDGGFHQRPSRPHHLRHRLYIHWPPYLLSYILRHASSTDTEHSSLLCHTIPSHQV